MSCDRPVLSSIFHRTVPIKVAALTPLIPTIFVQDSLGVSMKSLMLLVIDALAQLSTVKVKESVSKDIGGFEASVLTRRLKVPVRGVYEAWLVCVEDIT